MTEEKNKKEKGCPLCKVSEETLLSLRESGRQKYLSQKEAKEKEKSLKNKEKRMKKILNFWVFILIGVAVVASLKYFWSKSSAPQDLVKTKITVFYSPTCSCCHQYIAYLRRNGFEVLEEKDMTKRMDLLEKYQIPQDYTACHTSLVGDYFVEGHMPVEVIKKLLEEKPEIDGIALPGMPAGSPGMGGFKTRPFQIYSLSRGQISEFLTF